MGKRGKGGETNVKMRKWKRKGARRVEEERIKFWRRRGGETEKAGGEERRKRSREVCDECSDCSGSAAHLEVQQFNTRSNEQVRLRVSEHRERMEHNLSLSNHMLDVR